MEKKLSETQLNTWRLFITVQARLLNEIDADLKAAEQIPLHWYDVLIELYEADDRRLRMSDLADNVVLSRSGLTRLVDRLEDAGMLRRERTPEDKRGSYAVLTDSGHAALKSAWPVYSQGILEYFADYLTDDETGILERALTRMLDASKLRGES